MSNFRVTRDLSLTQQKAAREAVALILTVLYRCGYFMSFQSAHWEPTTDLVFLGVGCDTVQRRFYMLWDKLRKLQAILREVFGSRRISYSQLEKLGREMYEYVRSGTTGQPVHTPHVPPDS